MTPSIASSSCGRARINARFYVIARSAFWVLALPFAGCNRGPTPIDLPDWDPAGLAETIVAELDKNGDASVDGEELKASPGLAAGVSDIDKDKNGQLSREEIESVFSKYIERRLGLTMRTFCVTYKGRPVPDAEVKFIPESFLEGVIEPAAGTTDSSGLVMPQTEGQEVVGLRLGYYRVQVTSPTVKIPEKYAGPGTTLGANVALVNGESGYGANSVGQLKLTD